MVTRYNDPQKLGSAINNTQRYGVIQLPQHCVLSSESAVVFGTTVKTHKIRLIELVQIKNDGDYVFNRVKRYIHSVEAIGTVDKVLLER